MYQTYLVNSCCIMMVKSKHVHQQVPNSIASNVSEILLDIVLTQKQSKTFIHTNSFTNRRFYTKTKNIHTHILNHTHIHTHTLLHKNLFTHRRLLHTDAFTHNGFDTQSLTHRHVYTQKAFTHRRLRHTTQNRTHKA